MNQEESEHNGVDGMKKGTDSTSEVMHIKHRLVICNDYVSGWMNYQFMMHCNLYKTDCTSILSNSRVR